VPPKRRLPSKALRMPLRPSPRIQVRRDEFELLLDTLNRRAEFMDALKADLNIQFKRIANIQAELDELKRLVAKLGHVA
jgi:hypothetical protein